MSKRRRGGGQRWGLCWGVYVLLAALPYAFPARGGGGPQAAFVPVGGTARRAIGPPS